MIVELGHFALVLALMVALAQACVPLVGAMLGRDSYMNVARSAAGVLFALVTLSFAALTYAYATSDFSVVNVVENSHSLMPRLYKFTAVWGNHEGSMLLWVWMLALWGFAVAWAARNLPNVFTARALGVQGLMTVGFILFILLTSNPFLRAFPPSTEGLGLNPVLQDPALALHPPLLYMGYVGFSVAFCFAMAGLLGRSIDATWARFVRPWVLAAWVALTIGIALGSFWAYYELGWGGFWFWDPVENASLMPWLAGTALLHAVVALEKRDTLRAWTVFLAILAFALALLGTFLVRSGVLTSVHAFATDPARGLFILVLLTIAVGGAFLLYALRGGDLKAGARFAFVSRETAIVFGNVFLFTFCVTVFLGTLYPVIMAALDLGSISVGPPYYAMILLPMLLPFGLLMSVGPQLAWHETKGKMLWRKMRIPLLAGAPFGIAMVVNDPAMPWRMALAGMAAVWIVVSLVRDVAQKKEAGTRLPLSYYGMVVAHCGIALLIWGVMSVSVHGEEKIQWMKPNDAVTIAGQRVVFKGVHSGEGPNYTHHTGTFIINDDVQKTAEKRWYPAAETPTSEVAMAFHVMNVTYIALGDQDAKQPARWVVRVYYHPGLGFIYLGALGIAAGGILAALRRKEAKA